MSDPLERLFRHERAAIVATLARRLRDLDEAEEALQDALTKAAARWPADGVPTNPGAWLTTVAWRSALDRRRGREHLALDEQLKAPGTEEELGAVAMEDDTLSLILTCCHPALPAEARVALTLRHVAGLDDDEIAAAFLVSRAAMTKRLVRARRKLRAGGVRFTLPTPDDLPGRLASTREVIGQIFSEGYLASGDDVPIRTELCSEASWLARQLLLLTPGDAETTALHAMILLHTARLPARQDAGGRLLAFAEQDTGAWDRDALEEARRLLAQTGRGPLGPFQLQAAIAAVHTLSAYEGRRVPWQHVARLYAVLAERFPSPVVEVNRAIAVGRSEHPRAGLLILDAVAHDPRLAEYVPFHAARADLLARDGDTHAAQDAWARACALSRNPAQRAALERRASEPVITG